MIIKNVTYNELSNLCWTEDNRLQGVQDNKIGAYYGYDSQGERGLKLTGPTIQVNINGYTYQVSALKEQTLYASPLITINDKGYTKHYFEEGKRICSKIGSGELRDINNLVGHMEMNYEEQLTTQYEGIKGGSMSCFGGGWFDLENNNLYKSIIQPYENPINPDEPIFYYHSDHLGSASFLTDTNGIETQQLVYLPFGEDWVDMKYNTGQYDTPYKFNGKEKDQETGYNYYGARYYYDWASIWLSVDPMSDKYPHLTSYNYCANNPVMLIDPDGREIDPASEGEAVNQFNDAHAKINSEISKYNSKIDKAMKKWGDKGFNANSKYAKQISKLNETRSELMDLKNSFDEVVNSDVSFYLTTKENPDGKFSAGGSTFFNTEKNRVDISFVSGALGSIVHETRHGYGFLLGEWGWDANKNEPTSYDYQDEFNAISNRNIFDFTFGYSKNFKSNNDIKNEVKRGYDNLNFINKKFQQICVPKR